MISLMTGLLILWNGCFDMAEDKTNDLQEVYGSATYRHHINDCLTFAIISPICAIPN